MYFKSLKCFKKMTNIFKAQTGDGYNIKVLIDLLQCNIKIGNFKISKEGIKLRMIDTQKKILINLILNSKNFQIYKYKLENEICIGVNLLHLYKMLNSIKKKDSIQLFINEDKEHLGIKVMPRDNDRVTTSYINTHLIQNLDIRLPKGYTQNIMISSSEYALFTYFSSKFNISLISN